MSKKRSNRNNKKVLKALRQKRADGGRLKAFRGKKNIRTNRNGGGGDEEGRQDYDDQIRNGEQREDPSDNSDIGYTDPKPPTKEE